ncbi:MAG TPA: amidohydrolase family protein [Edaphobacter sp.]|nr:amidohydrolase family protein [Edaphobacter sp.]
MRRVSLEIPEPDATGHQNATTANFDGPSEPCHRLLIGGVAWPLCRKHLRPSPSHFVDLLDFSPSEALQCDTRIGGQVMGLGDELGQIKEGYLADLLLVDGDSLKDLDLVVHEKNRHVMMKEGALYKDHSAATIVEHTVAAD